MNRCAMPGIVLNRPDDNDLRDSPRRSGHFLRAQRSIRPVERGRKDRVQPRSRNRCCGAKRHSHLIAEIGPEGPVGPRIGFTLLATNAICRRFESGRQDLNLRPPGPQPARSGLVRRSSALQSDARFPELISVSPKSLPGLLPRVETGMERGRIRGPCGRVEAPPGATRGPYGALLEAVHPSEVDRARCSL
jgi:hypothetical protein